MFTNFKAKNWSCFTNKFYRSGGCIRQLGLLVWTGQVKMADIKLLSYINLFQMPEMWNNILEDVSTLGEAFCLHFDYSHSNITYFVSSPKMSQKTTCHVKRVHLLLYVIHAVTPFWPMYYIILSFLCSCLKKASVSSSSSWFWILTFDSKSYSAFFA